MAFLCRAVLGGLPSKYRPGLTQLSFCDPARLFHAAFPPPTLRHNPFVPPGPEELKLATCSSRGTVVEALLQSRIQELWRAVAVEVQRLQGSLGRKESSVENLSQEVLESKKILWEELEAVQAELQRIHQKLKSQDVDITRNLVSIKKMRENQVGCIKFLAQLKGRVSGQASEATDGEPGKEDAW